jgi:hypothetical protein
MKHFRILAALLFCISVTAAYAQATTPVSLVGTRKLTAADKILPGGEEVRDYGADPHGMAIFTADGSYMVEIYRAERLQFAGNDKAKGSPEEYKDASLSTSCHFGSYSIDTTKAKIVFKVDHSSFPNWDGTSRAATFKLEGDTLSWRSPARPDGSVPVTILKRVREL